MRKVRNRDKTRCPEPICGIDIRIVEHETKSAALCTLYTIFHVFFSLLKLIKNGGLYREEKTHLNEALGYCIE